MSRVKIGITSAAFLLASCAADDHPDLKAFVTNSDDSLRGHVTSVAQVKPPDTVIYQAFDQTDPFSAKRMRPPEVHADGVSWTPPGRREALEAYPLDALHMVGTMEREGKRWALVKTPDNNVHRVARGNRIGQNFGAVALVTEGSITLSEHVQDGGGLWVERTTSLPLLEQTDTH